MSSAAFGRHAEDVKLVAALIWAIGASLGTAAGGVGVTDTATADTASATTARATTAIVTEDPSAEERDEPAAVVLTLFWSEGCPYCAAEREFLADLVDEYPALVVREYEISSSRANRELFIATAADYGIDARAVPTTFLGERSWVGFDGSVARQIVAAVDTALRGGGTGEGDGPSPGPDSSGADLPGYPERSVRLPFVGDVEVEDRSLVASTLLISFVDGFNPCSFWVLSMLLALVLRTGSRRRVLAVGLTFLAVTSLLYGIYIVGLLSVLSYIAYLDWIRAAVAAVALALGLLNIKDYLAPGRGPSTSIDPRHRPALYRRMRAVSVAEGSLAAALAGTVGLAVGVSLIETPCTAGFPILWSNLVSDAGVSWAEGAALFALYLGVFLLDEVAVFSLAVVTMRATKLGEHQGRVLKLVGGSVMVTLAAVLIAAPDLMESLTGVGIVTAGAAGLATAVAGMARLTGGPPSTPTGAGIRQGPTAPSAPRARR